jgi:hypothetical protein
MGKPGPHLILFKLSLNEVKTKAISSWQLSSSQRDERLSLNEVKTKAITKWQMLKYQNCEQLSPSVARTKAIQDGNRFEKIMRGKLSVGHSLLNT